MKTSIAFAMAVLACAACASEGGGGGDDDGPASCGNGVVDSDETCDDGNTASFDGCTSSCQLVDLIDVQPMTWTYLEIEGTQCIDGSPSGFSVNVNPDSPNVYVYLEGGGACFNTYCESLFTWSGNIPGGSGVFDRNNPANPVRDWTFVYVPYCSGDIYGGQKDTMLGGELRTFRGYSNFTAFLERWVPSFEAEQVVLSGSSAGGFGAMVNYSQTQRAFGDTPVTLIDDSGPPLSTEVFPPCLQEIFVDVWGLDETLLADCGDDCAARDDYVVAYLDHVRDEFPDTRGGVFSSQQDNTIRLFAGYGWSGGWNSCSEIPSQVSGTVYTAGLEELREHLMDQGDTFGTYYVPGNGHTILRQNGFYEATSGGMSPAQWVEATIAGNAQHVGP